MPRMRLYLQFDRSLAPGELEEYRELVKRRGKREPLQHLVGTVSFCGFELTVNRDVLVPRPETELLAERAWEYLQKQCPSGVPQILDFGTGSGCLAVVLAIKCPTAEISALDVSAEALRVAAANSARHGVTERIRFYQGAGFATLPKAAQYDLIVSNPPYIPTGELERLEPEVRDYDPRQALDGGVDGLDYYRMFANQAAAFMKPAARLMLELGDGQASRVSNFFREQNWIVESIVDDYTHRPRIIIASKTRLQPNEDEPK
jgi:release factor glutamine methyltransferase